jgi:hypothetical protein
LEPKGRPKRDKEDPGTTGLSWNIIFVMLSIISVIWHLLYISFYKFIERNQIRAQADSVAHHFCDVEYHFGDLASLVHFFL